MPIQYNLNNLLLYQYSPDYLINPKYTPYITNPSGLNYKGLGTLTTTDLVIDGGNVVRCDDSVIMTEKIFYENPKYPKNRLYDTLCELFGCEVIVLPWDRMEKYGHSDGIVRFIDHGKVLMTNYQDYDYNIAEEIQRILNRHYSVEVLEYQTEDPYKNNWAYINFLQTSEVILLPSFGVEEDYQALEQIENYYPYYKGKVIPVKINTIVNQGGGLNCISWNIYKEQ